MILAAHDEVPGYRLDAHSQGAVGMPELPHSGRAAKPAWESPTKQCRRTGSRIEALPVPR